MVRVIKFVAVGSLWLMALGTVTYGYIPGFLGTLAAVAGTLGAYNVADWRSRVSFTIPRPGVVGSVLAVALFFLSTVTAPNLTLEESNKLQTAISNENWSAVLVLLDDFASVGRTEEQEQLYQTAKAELAVQASNGGDWIAVVALLEDGERTEDQEQIYRTAKATHDEAIQRLQSEENWSTITDLLDIQHAGVKRSNEQERVYHAAYVAQAQAKKAAEEAEEEAAEQRKNAAEESMKRAEEEAAERKARERRATATPEPRSVEQGNPAYPHLLVQNATFIGEALGKLGALMLSPKLTSAGWKEEVELQVFVVKTLYAEATIYDPPPKFAAVHRQYLSATKLFDEAMDDIMDGIDNFDTAAIERATEKMTRGGERLNEATRMVDEIIRKASTTQTAKAEEQRATATPEPRSVEQGNPAYPHMVAQNAASNGEALGKLGALMSRPKFTSDSWRDDVELQVFIVKTNNAEAKLYDPPPKFAAVHRQYLSVTKLYDEAMDDLIDGIDNFDVAALERGNEKLTRGNELLDEATRMVDEIMR